MGSCGANPGIECASIKNALNLVRQYFEQIPLGTLKPGIYTFEVQAGQSANRSIFFMP